MEEIYLIKKSEVMRAKKMLEEKLQVSITIEGRKAIIEGDSVEEFEAKNVFDAINFGFSAQKAILIKDPEMIFRIIHIKDYTRKKDISKVKARIIGKMGKTLKTLQELSESNIILRENEIGIIGSAEQIENISTAIQNLIRGTKQANIYYFLEKLNRTKE